MQSKAEKEIEKAKLIIIALEAEYVDPESPAFSEPKILPVLKGKNRSDAVAKLMEIIKTF